VISFVKGLKFGLMFTPAMDLFLWLAMPHIRATMPFIRAMFERK